MGNISAATPKRYYLVRHCQAGGQEPDAPLTAEGIRQANQLFHFFKDKQIEHIRSSPYKRAIDSIKPLSDGLNLDIQMDDRLREWFLSAVPLDDWMDRFKAAFDDANLAFPGGESSREATGRAMTVIEELAQRPERTMVVVTHGGLLSLLIRQYNPDFGFEGWRQLTNPDVFQLDMDRGSATIQRVQTMLVQD